MNSNFMEPKTVAAAITITSIVHSTGADKTSSVDDLLAQLKEDKTRAQAWNMAAIIGAPAVKAMAQLLPDADFELARAAKRALQHIVRHANRPGAEKERVAVVKELLPFADKKHPLNARRDVLWMLSEIAGDEAVSVIAAILAEEDLREDARMTLERIPGNASLKALQKGLKTVPEKFKYNIASSLRARGVEVKEYPSQRLVPTKATTVKINKTA